MKLDKEKYPEIRSVFLLLCECAEIPLNTNLSVLLTACISAAENFKEVAVKNCNGAVCTGITLW